MNKTTTNRLFNSLVNALMVAVLLLATGPAAAQTTDDTTRLREEIERNGDLLREAQALVAETNSAKARASLQFAAELHKESIRLFQLGPGDGNLLRAAQVATRAREAILQTIAIAKRESKLEESTRQAIERATTRLEIGRNILQNSPEDNPAARKLLEEAHQHLQRAHHNLRERLYEVALKLAVSSEELSRSAIKMMRRDVGGGDYLERELEKTDRALERLATEITNAQSDGARRVLDEARDLQHRAREAAASNQGRLALELTQRSRNMAMRALRAISGGASIENVERALQLTDQLLDRAHEIAQERDSRELRERVEQTQRLQDQARDHYLQGDLEQSLRMTLRAREMLKDTISGLARDLDPEEVQAAIDGTDDVLERAAETVSDSDNEVAESLIARAREKQERARAHLAAGQMRPALANTRLARRLARRAVATVSGDEI